MAFHHENDSDVLLPTRLFTKTLSAITLGNHLHTQFKFQIRSRLNYSSQMTLWDTSFLTLESLYACLNSICGGRICGLRLHTADEPLHLSQFVYSCHL